MVCISLHQPWASLLVYGFKRVETLSWELRHRGPLAVHAAKKWNVELAELCVLPPFRAALESIGVEFVATEAACRKGWNLPFGAIVGRVNVVDCCPTDMVTNDGVEAPWKWSGGGRGLLIGPTEYAFGDYTGGRFAWLCDKPFAFAEPHPCAGKQSLFEVDDEILAGIV